MEHLAWSYPWYILSSKCKQDNMNQPCTCDFTMTNCFSLLKKKKGFVCQDDVAHWDWL
jgi:hypothetical protein